MMISSQASIHINVGNDYNKLRQLILLEELKHCAHPRVKTFLDEQDPNDIYDAAEKADSFALTHKLSNKQNDQSFHNKYRPSKQPAFPEKEFSQRSNKAQ